MSMELRPRELENASGAEMPVMLEGALKALSQIRKTKRTTGATGGPNLEGFSLRFVDRLRRPSKFS